MMNDIIQINKTNLTSLLQKPELLSELGKPYAKQIFLLKVHLAGTSFIENIKELEPQIEKGAKLNFFREPDNHHDSFAIIVKDVAGHKLGYIPRRKNIILSRLMDAGKLIYGTIYKKEFVKEWLKITIQVFLDD